jgi:cell division protease FtsH
MFLRKGGLPWGGGEREYSEETARLIDEEVRQIVERNYDRVRGLLSVKKETLLQAAAVLKQRETLHGDELRALLAGVPAAV